MNELKRKFAEIIGEEAVELFGKTMYALVTGLEKESPPKLMLKNPVGGC